jgi:hypothetical protein
MDMKKKTVWTMMACWFSLGATAQTATPAPAVELAQRIAAKMKDSLGLTEAQRAGIYQVNLQLHGQKQQARQQHAGDPAQLGAALQAIERGRDSLYRPLLAPTEFLLYKQKKKVLITNK